MYRPNDETKKTKKIIALTLVCVISFASFSEASDICCWICLLNKYLLISSSLLFNKFSGNLKLVSTRRRNAAFIGWPSPQSMPCPMSLATTEQLASILASARHNSCRILFFSINSLSKSVLRCRSVCILADGTFFVAPGDSVVSVIFADWLDDNSTFWKMFGVRVAFRTLASAIRTPNKEKLEEKKRKINNRIRD